jgi:hypothetical protein
MTFVVYGLFLFDILDIHALRCGKCGNHDNKGKGGKGDTNYDEKALSFTLYPLHSTCSWYCALARGTMMARERMTLVARVMTMITADNDDGKGKGDVGTNYDNDSMGREGRAMGQNSNKEKVSTSTRVDNYIARSEMQ